MLVARWRDADDDSVTVVAARTTLGTMPLDEAWRVGADVPGDSVVLSVAWRDVLRWEVAAEVREHRTPRVLAVAAGFAGAIGGAWLAGGGTGNAMSPLLGAAVAGALLGASQPERRMLWRAAAVPRSRVVVNGGED
jgi:hypothetical protein